MIDIRLYASDPDAEKRKVKYDRKLIKKGWDPEVVALMPAPLPWFHLPHHHQAWQAAHDSLKELNGMPSDERSATLQEVLSLLEQRCPCCGEPIPR